MIVFHLAIIFGEIIVAFLATWIFSILCLRKYKRIIQIEDVNDFALERAFHRFAVWYKSAMFWTVAEYVFVIVPFVSNVVVIYLTNIGKDSCDLEIILLHSIVSLSFVVFGYAINPRRHKKCYRKAYRCLDNSISEYLSALGTGNPNSAMLDKGTKDGEDYIDPSYDIE